MAAAAEQLGNLSVASYVQLTDTEMECDGVLSYDRTPKFSAEQIAMIRKGAGNQTASFSSHLYIKKDRFLPRQARDKHQKTTIC